VNLVTTGVGVLEVLVYEPFPDDLSLVGHFDVLDDGVQHGRV